MNINCFCLVQDLVLNYIIKNYILKTPFLSFTQCDIMKENFFSSDIENIDLVIAEINMETKEKIYKILSHFENKYFLLLSDLDNFLKPIDDNKTVILKKDITYSDFINALNSLVSHSEKTKLNN